MEQQGKFSLIVLVILGLGRHSQTQMLVYPHTAKVTNIESPKSDVERDQKPEYVYPVTENVIVMTPIPIENYNLEMLHGSQEDNIESKGLILSEDSTTTELSTIAEDLEFIQHVEFGTEPLEPISDEFVGPASSRSTASSTSMVSLTSTRAPLLTHSTRQHRVPTMRMRKQMFNNSPFIKSRLQNILDRNRRMKFLA